MNKNLNELIKACENALEYKKRILIGLSGFYGSGKSTFGKMIRKNGFGNFKPYQIAVIDDDVISINLVLFHPKKKIKSIDKDELKPFFKFLPPYIKIIFYINTNLNERISKMDILCILKIDEQERINRLIKRNGKNTKKLSNFINETKLNLDNLDYKIKIML